MKPLRVFSSLIDRNISAVHKTRLASDQARRLDHRVFDSIAFRIGSTGSFYFHIVIYGSLFYGLNQRGADSSLLSMVASLEALFLTILVLANQRRMNAIARTNSDLHLQTTLLAENELSKIAKVIEAIGENLEVDPKLLKNLTEIAKDIHPNDLIERIEEHSEQKPTDFTKR